MWYTETTEVIFKQGEIIINIETAAGILSVYNA